ncbi:MAG: OmpA family protein [Deltaproteobacteria bacterium]|nr:OmpA family protein [Deltaproteobacteria bacterium]
MAIDRSANRLVIRLNNVLLFPPGQATLTPVAEDVIGSVVGILSRIEAPIRVEGHTDNVPIRTPQYPSNWELSTARAIAVVDFLEGRGIARARLSAAGYAEFHAIAANDSEAHRALNRRVELVVIGGGT